MLRIITTTIALTVAATSVSALTFTNKVDANGNIVQVQLSGAAEEAHKKEWAKGHAKTTGKTAFVESGQLYVVVEDNVTAIPTYKLTGKSKQQIKDLVIADVKVNLTEAAVAKAVASGATAAQAEAFAQLDTATQEAVSAAGPSFNEAAAQAASFAESVADLVDASGALSATINEVSESVELVFESNDAAIAHGIASGALTQNADGTITNNATGATH